VTTFEGCAAAGVKCTSLGTSKVGQIVVEGEARLVYDNEAPLGVAIADPLLPVHFTCSAKLLVITGCGLGLVKSVNTSVAAGANYEVSMKQSSGQMENTQ
jgi:hypothetical protein